MDGERQVRPRGRPTGRKGVEPAKGAEQVRRGVPSCERVTVLCVGERVCERERESDRVTEQATITVSNYTAKCVWSTT